ncbi:polysaccharide pyruvyl transferase family protein [Tamlana crocina]|uniref:Polysaccharide pyruvyl transferase domain-containing protein n=1 Tax=Tamlana crocina TaxID=393006 RepID=A0ABX1D9V2_9FLAO|nr:polysaccharide pyruvyl transferase family protein [Tamlana crocina]NJX15158.1 hypothetical protein [Tamlana crocina]
MISSIKKSIPLVWKVKYILSRLESKPISYFDFKTPAENKKRIFIFLAADYGNLGDVAITYAQHKFLNRFFPDAIVTEIPISNTLEGIAFVKKIIQPNDIITTVGGGNTGDLYESIELYRRLVIEHFPGNKIISFPQTIDFSETTKGLKERNKTIKTYSKHNHLTLVAREQKSFDYYNTHFPKNKVVLTPDIVLSQNQSVPQIPRHGAIVCLRDDKEKKLSVEQENNLKALLKKEFNHITIRDTHVGGQGLPLKNRVSKLKSIWGDFKTVELVITDRLHGMIFCYITGTPALVFLNNNHKIKSSYSWIKQAKHIRLVEDLSENSIKNAIAEVKGQQTEIDLETLVSKYHPIVEAIKN